MHRRTARFNRIMFVLLGLVLLGAGGFLLGRYFDWFAGLPSSQDIYSSAESRWLRDHDWIWLVVAAVSVIIGLIALRWLLVQPRIDRLRTLRLDADLDQPGRTAMASDVLTDAVEDDIDAYPGVARARALLIGATDAPELIVRVGAQPSADLAEVHHRIVTEALPAARAALDSPGIPAQIHLIVTGRRTVKRVGS